MALLLVKDLIRSNKMQIEDGFEFEDLLTGMKIKFTEEELNFDTN